MEERKIQTESLTKSVYYLFLSIQFMEDFKRSCRQEAKYNAGRWVDRLLALKNDVYNSLTPESRERFLEEITANPDPLFSQSISELWIQMSNEQRELLERLANGVLSGVQVEIT